MPSPSQAGGLDAVAVEVVLADPHRRARAERIIDRLFGDVEYLLEFGSSSDRMSLQKSVMPAILRSVQSAAQNQALDQLREDHEKLRQALMGMGTPPPTGDE